MGKSASVTIVVPTFNEASNVGELLRRLDGVKTLCDIEQVIFVDDSDDDTAAAIFEALARVQVPVRVIHRESAARFGGLSGAVIASITATASPCSTRRRTSRYCSGGDSSGLSNGFRRFVSAGSTRLASLLFPLRLRCCTDSMTGFFAVRRDAIDVSTLRARGFKILLEILVRHRVRVVEVPFTFPQRVAGDSKASIREGTRFLAQLARLRWDMWWSTRRSREIVSFGVVGLAKLVLDMGLFNALLVALHSEPAVAKVVSSTVATAASYFMNRHWTWPDRCRAGLNRELPLFMVLSGIAIGISEACLVFSHYVLSWRSPIADNVSANVAGLALGTLWRFWSFRRWVFTEQPVAALHLSSVDESSTGRSLIMATSRSTASP